MKKKYLKILIACFLVINFTGCTQYLKTEDNKIIKNSETGQNLPQNILCKPTDKKTIKIYEDYNQTSIDELKVNLESLPACDKLSPTEGNYEGIWTSVFVKPLAFLIIQIGILVKSYGFGLIIATLLIRGVVWPFTKKTAMQSELLKKARPELDKLENKYKNNKSNEAMMQKSQEMMMIYKKYNISPLSGCLFSFIQIPLFFAFYEAISRIPAIFEETFLGFQLGTSPLTALLSGKYYYLIFIVLIVAATYFSFKLNSSMSVSKEQEKQMKMMTNIMVIFMTITAFSISSGIAIYWITSNLFTIVQNLLVRRNKKND
ncbi:MAG: YidC/Oxa1 family membrane protein insertase [Bacilli bacterium]